jgi:ABC-type transporter Mla maintaining outer membrane lipid asymmetry permease subunit MlaE
MSAGAVLCCADLLNEGFQVASSARSLARLTTLSGVESVFLVIVVETAFSVVFSGLQI